MTNQLTFNDIHFNVINRSNQIWLSSKEIANALGYKTTYAVTKVYNQNLDEFTSGMTDVVETPNLGSSKNLRVRSRIFSLRGAHLIAMFARTPVAKEFRRWVLDILDREVGNVSIEPVKSKLLQCTTKQLTPLRQTAERLITTGLGKIYPDIWKFVHQRFDVEHIQQLHPDQIGEAIEYLNILEGEYIQREAASKKKTGTTVRLPRLGDLKNGERLLIEVDERGNISQRKLKDEIIVGTIDTFLWIQDRAGFMAIRKDAIPEKKEFLGKMPVKF